MKKQILLVLILALFNNILIAQKVNSEIAYFYKYSYHTDSTNIDKINTEDTVLLTNSKESLFCSYTKMKNDSTILSNIQKGNMVIDYSVLPKSKVNQIVFVNKEKENIITYDKVINVTFGFPVSQLEWTLGKEHKKIGEFDCQNAYCILNGRKFEAWFTKSVPVNEGPYRFKGLPGLIVEVYDDKKFFYFILNGIKKQTLSTELPKNFIPTTIENFKSKRQEFLNNPAGVTKVYMGDRIKIDPQVVNNNFKNYNLFLD
ncbi:hypothetical protein ACM39_03750 [Chryseobacterium sp. FH2]|uniref:GLPGLI family protein n=1 Tax=Chryseobacterium sp. FH2 TaxID=1674291 RepID=UPI00065AFFD6|nr:GLPGLI family protein [Chryseobacterium sp. FH2]KMQ69225.1 hypothetical protein ACM39_03750 [Chryseobacterium sp. FH2]